MTAEVEGSQAMPAKPHSEQAISEATGFDNGDRFADDASVRAYFTVAEQRHMFGDDAITDQNVLDDMARTVIKRELERKNETCDPTLM